MVQEIFEWSMGIRPVATPLKAKSSLEEKDCKASGMVDGLMGECQSSDSLSDDLPPFFRFN